MDPAIIKQLSDLLVARLPLFVQSGWVVCILSRPLTRAGDLEVQERAVFAVELLKLVTQSVENGSPPQWFVLSSISSIPGEPMYSALTVLFEGELNPVHQSAIEHVPIPEGLNLDEWIHEPPPEQSFDVCVPSAAFAIVSFSRLSVS